MGFSMSKPSLDLPEWFRKLFNNASKINQSGGNHQRKFKIYLQDPASENDRFDLSPAGQITPMGQTIEARGN